MKSFYTGLMYAVLMSVLFACNYVMSKYLTTLHEPIVVAMYWAAFGFIFSFVYFLVFSRQRLVSTWIQYRIGVIVMGLLGCVGIVAWFLGNYYLGPGLNSLMNRFRMIFLIILGIIFLKERLNRWEVLCIGGVLLGLFVLFYRFHVIFWIGIVASLISAIVVSIQSFYVKRFLSQADSAMIALFRLGIVGVILIGWGLFSGHLIPLTLHEVAMFGFAGAVGAIAGRWANYETVKRLDVSVVEVFGSLENILVLTFAYFLFGDQPSVREIVGAGIIMLAVSFLAVVHGRKQRAKFLVIG